jgi:hypothetical protein
MDSLISQADADQLSAIYFFSRWCNKAIGPASSLERRRGLDRWAIPSSECTRFRGLPAASEIMGVLPM